MAREQGRHDRQTRPAREVSDGCEPADHYRIDRARGRLKRLPGEEEPDRVETGRGDPREVGCDLVLVEARPPGHRGASRPVVDADPEARSTQWAQAPRGPPRRVERHDPLVDGQVLVHHPLDIEAFFDRCAHRPPFERRRLADCCDRLLDGLDEETVLTVADQFRHRSARAGDHRGSAGHRLDDAEAERLVEVDQVQERARAAEQFAARARARPARGRSPALHRERFHEPLEVLVILDDPGDQQRQARPFRDFDRLGGPLSGWIRPKNSK